MYLECCSLRRSLVICVFALFQLTLWPLESDQQQMFAAVPPPIQSSEHFARLAKSPSSSLLASQFFAAERQRAGAFPALQPAGGVAPQRQASSVSATTIAGAQQPLSMLASDTPTYSVALAGENFRLDQYHTLEEIYAFMDSLARRHRRRVKVFTIGQTAEQRPVRALELINNSTDADFVWLDALTHAREWITGSTLLYTLDQLVAGNNLQRVGGGNLGNLAWNKNYIIVPVVNPDGYAYTWTHNRMWRKNRSKSPNSSASGKCVGADLNRNFDHSFGGEGASSDPCSHIYSGAFPFSEPETRALADLMWSLRDRIKFYLTIHSFNQLWACPYAHTTEQSAHLQLHMRVLSQIQRAVREAEGVNYEIGPLSTSLYVGSGFGIDFAYDKCGIINSYLVELRDRGANGFVLPPDQIMPTARETFAGLRAGLRAVFA